ncbi:uncharacterized protein LOC143414052 [Maylandia zebra]|uniref:uncharacterized protein LOC143414052 n=1 Tax=Maylandia zebra TaxID=106582 RepID=UPI00403D44F0
MTIMILLGVQGERVDCFEEAGLFSSDGTPWVIVIVLWSALVLSFGIYFGNNCWDRDDNILSSTAIYYTLSLGETELKDDDMLSSTTSYTQVKLNSKVAERELTKDKITSE